MQRAMPLALAVATVLSLLPAAPAEVAALPMASALGVTAGDLAQLGPALAPLQEAAPRAPGTITRASFLYGPFTIPPGHDLSRVLLDVPLRSGFVTKLAYRLADGATGEFPTNMEVHIHHALWFRVDPAAPGVFDFDDLLLGTGEERTQLDLDARADAVPGGPRYGIPFRADEAQNVAFMLHNKEARTRTVHVLLEVTFVQGDAASIAAAQECANPVPLPWDAGCAAGLRFHRVDGRLWGAIFDVPRGSGTYVFPPAYGTHVRYVAQESGEFVVLGGHVHPEGIEVLIANLGSAAEPCGDLDGDGVPGITLLRSRKFDRDPRAAPHSEDFQMGLPRADFRAPVRAGDRIAQFGLYANAEHPSYYQMTFAAAHVDIDAPPAPRAGGCTLANTGPRLLGGGDPTVSAPNRAWDGPALPLCGAPFGVACDMPDAPALQGGAAERVVIAGFTYVPGDRNLAGPFAAVPRVAQGASLTFVNADFGAQVRHSVTSCPWPCNGPYRGNYPLPDGGFDSGNLGNVDLFNGEGVDAEPVWTLGAGLEPGLYSYYCRLHPSMRGAFEVEA